MRAMRVRVAPEMLLRLMTRDHPGHRVDANPLPADARIIRASMEDPRYIELLVESSEYPETLPGSLFPEAPDITLRALDGPP